MTARTITTQEPTTRPAFHAARFTDVLHSEWTKARTVRSTIWTLVAAAVLGAKTLLRSPSFDQRSIHRKMLVLQ